MMSSMTEGSMPDLRTTSGSTVVISVSGGVLTSVPLNERPIAVRTAPTITGVAMSQPQLGFARWDPANRIKYGMGNSNELSSRLGLRGPTRPLTFGYRRQRAP